MVKRTGKDEIAASVPEVPADIQNDEFRGHGGSYIIDPATSKRIRVEGPAVAIDGIRPEAGAEITKEETAHEGE